MMPEEISNLYIRIAFQYESALNQLVDKGLVDMDLADKSRQTFYNTLDEEKLRTAQKIRNHTEIIRRYMRGMICEGMVSLTEVARQYSKDSPGYIIQSWMRSRNTLEFLRQWENDMNGEFDDRACEELIYQAHTTSLTVTPSLWIRRTHAVGMRVKQGKGGGVSAYPEIAADFHLWLDPAERLALLRLSQEIRSNGEAKSCN
ncbi:hypothetical protein [Acutalibacter sp. JLR.KK004]|uniref:hypothetical protein n=1 Tax=Acutalibacter sp. JLR.KK004 TaxID=3112622 RepID=UPI002FF23AF9